MRQVGEGFSWPGWTFVRPGICGVGFGGISLGLLGIGFGFA